MKKHILIIISLATSSFCLGQEVVATAGQTHSAGNLIVSQTIGEAVVHSHQNGIQVDQGFQQYEMTVTSINEAPGQQIEVSVYPNPFAQQININSDQDLELVQVYNLTGSVVASQQIGFNQRKIEMNLSDLSAGQYLLRVQAINSSESNTYSIIKK